MTPTEVVALLEEIEIMWPGAPATQAGDADDATIVKIWHAWIGRYDYQVARSALQRIDQARPPSGSQVVAACRKLAGEQLPPADTVLAEFRRVAGAHSTQGFVDPTWFSSPEVGAFASSGAFRAWGESPDAAHNEYLAASQAAALASLRRRWDDFASVCEAQGLQAALERVGLSQPAKRQGELEPIRAVIATDVTL